MHRKIVSLVVLAFCAGIGAGSVVAQDSKFAALNRAAVTAKMRLVPPDERLDKSIEEVSVELELVKPKVKTARDKELYRRFEAVKTALDTLRFDWRMVKGRHQTQEKLKADLAGITDRYSGVKSIDSDQELASRKADLEALKEIEPNVMQTAGVIDEATRFYSTPPKATAKPKAKK
jgi:hypothetical protein